MLERGTTNNIRFTSLSHGSAYISINTSNILHISSRNSLFVYMIDFGIDRGLVDDAFQVAPHKKTQAGQIYWSCQPGNRSTLTNQLERISSIQVMSEVCQSVMILYHAGRGFISGYTEE